MKNFFLLALAGVIAQLVDGSLGMAYGVSSTTVLLAAGGAPAPGFAGAHIGGVGGTVGLGRYWERWCWSGQPRWKRRRATSSRRWPYSSSYSVSTSSAGSRSGGPSVLSWSGTSPAGS